MTLLFWNYVAVPFYQAAYALFDIGYSGDDGERWGGSERMRRFYEGEIPVDDLTNDPQEQEDLLWSKRVYERQQALVIEEHRLTVEVENFWPEFGHRIARQLVDETHSNSYYHYVNSGLQAAMDNQYLETVDQRHLDRIEELGAIDVKPYSVNLLTIEADMVGKVVELAWAQNGKADFDWSGTSGATSYDVVRGELLDLTAGAGLSAAVALSCDQPDTSASDHETPPAGDGFYYVVRGRDGSEVGSWGSAARNAEITACE